MLTVQWVRFDCILSDELTYVNDGPGLIYEQYFSKPLAPSTQFNQLSCNLIVSDLHAGAIKYDIRRFC